MEESYERFNDGLDCDCFLSFNVGICCLMQFSDGEIKMNGLLIAVGIIAMGLLIYLFISLIKPEWFG